MDEHGHETASDEATAEVHSPRIRGRAYKSHVISPLYCQRLCCSLVRVLPLQLLRRCFGNINNTGFLSLTWNTNMELQSRRLLLQCCTLDLVPCFEVLLVSITATISTTPLLSSSAMLNLSSSQHRHCVFISSTSSSRRAPAPSSSQHAPFIKLISHLLSRLASSHHLHTLMLLDALNRTTSPRTQTPSKPVTRITTAT